jgi:hypothetical protein
VDHFDYHARLGCPDFLLLLVKKGRPNFGQTETLARKALSLCPELQRLDWTWHSERYAGGHGNYLQSSPCPLPAGIPAPIPAFNNSPVRLAHWEIEFTASHPGHTLELWPHKHFGDQSIIPNSQTRDASPQSQTPITAVSRLNPQFNGVEIHFTRRPDDAALAPLRAAAWRYTGRSQCWYAKQTPATLAFAHTYVETFNQPKPNPDRFTPVGPVPSPGVIPTAVAPGPSPYAGVPQVSKPAVPPIPQSADRPGTNHAPFTDIPPATGGPVPSPGVAPTDPPPVEDPWTMAGEPNPLPEKWRQPGIAEYARDIWAVPVHTDAGSVMVGKHRLHAAAREQFDTLRRLELAPPRKIIRFTDPMRPHS